MLPVALEGSAAPTVLSPLKPLILPFRGEATVSKSVDRAV